MAGLRPGHPRLGAKKKDVDARHKAGHDEPALMDRFNDKHLADSGLIEPFHFILTL
jgi:hypothetical protein